VFLENLIEGHAVSDHLDHGRDWEAQVADAEHTAHPLWVARDPRVLRTQTVAPAVGRVAWAFERLRGRNQYLHHLQSVDEVSSSGPAPLALSVERRVCTCDQVFERVVRLQLGKPDSYRPALAGRRECRIDSP